ncbi:MAG TPA: DNA-binding anti-repressor SinI [Bacillota bacterium]|nr:DNA-binding anti-repressor SinI [Bacillota bacterium]
MEQEWIGLIIEARELGLTQKEVRHFWNDKGED